MSDVYNSSPTLRELYFELGQALSTRQRYKEAVIMFQQARDEEDTIPDKSLVLFHLARSQDQAGDRGAFRTYLDAIIAAPGQSHTVLPFVHNLLTRSFIESEQEWLQDEWMQKVASADLTEVDRANIAFLLGRVHIYLEEYSQALVFFEQAMHMLPTDVLVVEGFGEALWKTGKLEQAQEVLERAHEMTLQGMHQERLAAISIKLAQVYIVSDQYDAALSLITERQINDEHPNYESLIIRGECYLALSQLEQALEVLEIAIKVSTTDIRAYLLKAQSLIALGRDNDAASSIRQALQYDPLYLQDAIRSTVFVRRNKKGFFHYFFAHSYYMLGNLTEALQEINQALELGLIGESSYPNTSVLQLKARILEDSGAKEDAATYYYEAGWSLYWADKYEAAAERFERATELRPDFSMAYWYWADTLLALSYVPVAPYVHKDYIRSSLEVWDTARRIEQPGANYVRFEP